MTQSIGTAVAVARAHKKVWLRIDGNSHGARRRFVCTACERSYAGKEPPRACPCREAKRVEESLLAAPRVLAPEDVCYCGEALRDHELGGGRCLLVGSACERFRLHPLNEQAREEGERARSLLVLP